MINWKGEYSDRTREREREKKRERVGNNEVGKNNCWFSS